MASVSVLSGPVTRTWVLHLDGGRLSTVQLWHNTITGERSLSVDGVEVSGTAGYFTLLSTTAQLSFRAGGKDGKEGTVTMDHMGSRVVYRCLFDGAEVPEENSVPGGGAGSDAAVNRFKVSVDAGELGVDEDGKPIVWYKVHAVREKDERETAVHRRFNQFFGVNEALRSAYKGSHLLSSFPELPPRGVKLWENHMDPAFIERRRWLLADWLFKVEQIPRMRTNPDFLTFVGIIDAVRESSTIFPEGPLGLQLKQGGDFVEVSALNAKPDGSPSPAQASGVVSVGDKVSKVNGEDVLGQPYEVIIAKIKASPRPMVLHFLGYFNPGAGRAFDDNDSDGDRAAAAPVAAPAPAPAPAPAVAAAFAPAPAPVTGLIGDGVSWGATGATPKPGMAARTGPHGTAAATAAGDGANVRGMAGVI